MSLKNLPEPSDIARLHSERVKAYVCQKIKANQCLSFYEFMRDVLYAPGLGYYSAGSHKIGVEGDFITAPEMTPLFAQCIAKQYQSIDQSITDSVFLELGAGTGQFCADFLRACERDDCLPNTYYIIEVSADFRERQQLYLQAQIPHLMGIVCWLDALPSQPINGMVFANEVMDAMPVHCFQMKKGIQELCVTYEDEQLRWIVNDVMNDELQAQVQDLGIPLREGYRSEINCALPAWIKSIEACLSEGLILLVDYGFPRSEYYHPQRNQGTLMCHYRHRAHDNPFLWPGLQDITAHVDFTAVAESASHAGLTVAGYTHQAAFLASCGLLDLVNTTDAFSQYQVSQQIQQLMHPSEMGELFKVIALTKSFDEPLLGFSQLNQTYRL